MKQKNFKSDILLLGGLVLVGVVFAMLLMLTRQQGAQVQVSVSGTVTACYPLERDGVYSIAAENGGTNLLVIADGKAHMEEATCPDGLCVNMGSINKNGQSIVCLPNQVVVEVIGGEEAQDDGVDLIAGGKQ